jgi:uncharacterized protein (TIGR03546 family)
LTAKSYDAGLLTFFRDWLESIGSVVRFKTRAEGLFIQDDFMQGPATKRSNPMSGAFVGNRLWDLPAAIAMGSTIGWIPKSSLLAMGLVFAVVLARVPWMTAAIIGSIAAWTTAWNDAWIDRLGRALLETESLQPLWQAMAAMPVLPWLQWNNSVVLGSLAAGTLGFVPLLMLARVFHRDRIRRNQVERLENQIQQWQPATNNAFDDIDATALDLPSHITTGEITHYLPSPILKGEGPGVKVEQSTEFASKSPSIGSSRLKESTVRDIPRAEPLNESVTRLTEIVASATNKSTKKRPATDRRIAIDSQEEPARPNLIEVTSKPQEPATVAVQSDAAESPAYLHETVIEIVRYRNSENSKSSGKIKAPLTKRNSDPVPPDSNESPEDMQRNLNDRIRTNLDVKLHAESTLLPSNKVEASLEDSNADDRPREEALRYLLWHLSGVKRPNVQNLKEQAT